MKRRILVLCLCICLLISCAACAGKTIPKATNTGLAGFSQALTSAGYQTVVSTGTDGTTTVELIPPTTNPAGGTVTRNTQPTAPEHVSTTQATTQMATTVTNPATIVTVPSIVIPEIVFPEIIVPQPTAPTTVKPTQTTATTTKAPITATAAPVIPATTTGAQTIPSSQPTVPVATTVPVTTTVPVITTVPVTTTIAPTTTVPFTIIAPATTLPVTTTHSQPSSDSDYQTHTMIPYTQRYLYSTLNEVQKQWYQKIDAAVRNLENEVVLGSEIFEGDNYLIYYLYMVDNPEHFYMTNRIGVSSQSLLLGYSDGISASGACVDEETGNSQYLDITPELVASIRSKQRNLNNKIEQIVGSIPSDLPDVEKEWQLYKRVILSGSYNVQAQWDGYAEDNWTAYGILMNGKGVCESYSEAFQILCYSVGINCTGVVGGGHKWNAVCLDGEWYMCDPTWDDPVGNLPFMAFHKYFNLTTEQICLDHEIDESRWTVPVCIGTKYSYNNYFES